MPSFTISNPSISRTSSSTAVSRFPASSSTPSTPSTPQQNSPLSAPIYKRDAGSSSRATLNKSFKKGAPDQGARTSPKTLDGQNVTNMPSVSHETEIEIMEESSEGASQNSTNAPATEISLLDLIAMQMLEDGPRPKKRQHWIMDWWRTPSFKKNAPSIENELKAPATDVPRDGPRPKKRQHWIMDWWRTPSFKKNAPSIENELKAPAADTPRDGLQPKKRQHWIMDWWRTPSFKKNAPSIFGELKARRNKLKARIADASRDPSFGGAIKELGLMTRLVGYTAIDWALTGFCALSLIPVLLIGLAYLLAGEPYKEKVYRFFRISDEQSTPK